MPDRTDRPLTTGFDVRGMCLRATADAEWVLRRMRSIIGPYESPFARPEFDLDVRRSGESFDDAPPDGMEESWRGELPGGIPAVAFRNGTERCLLLPGKLRLFLNSSARRARISYAQPEEWRINLGGILPVLCEFLAQRRHYVVHAAALTLDGDDRDRAVLILGRSGLGKTTTALALALHGFRLLTDDACFLHRPDEGEPVAWGLPRPLKVHRETVRLLPELRNVCRGPLTVGEEYMTPLENVPGADVRGDGRPALLLFLEPRNAQGHHMEPMDRIAALARLVGENVRAADPRAEGPAGRAFQAFAEIVGECPSYRLSVGPKLDALGRRVTELMQGGPGHAPAAT
jgi:hypothetical protein